jgi:hypothetical protein
MKLVNFTEENLSKIHISQFMQFLDKYSHLSEYRKSFNRICLSNKSEFGYDEISFFESGLLCWKVIDNGYMNFFDTLLTQIYPDYQQGDLTQFHVLFTQVYNEIMGYEIK